MLEASKQCCACEAYNNTWLCLVLRVTKTNQVQKSVPQNCFSDSDSALPAFAAEQIARAGANSTLLNNNSH